jgi:hypothetical protein
MPSSVYYLDGPSLASSTSAYDDPGLNSIAPNGFYSDGVIVRELIDGVFQPQSTCPSCALPCNTGLVAATGDGVWYMDMDLGSSVGAVVVTLDFPTPNAFPVGIQVLYDGVIYNSGSSPIYGYLSGTSGLPVFLGNQSYNCGLIPNSPWSGVPVKKYDGTTFSASGLTETVNVANTQLDLTILSPAFFYMIIPKVNPSISTAQVKVITLCGSPSAFSIEVECPSGLVPFDSSQGGASAFEACESSISWTYYVFHVNGSAGTLGLSDMVFADVNGANPLADGYYQSNDLPAPNTWFQVVNGVVVQFGECIYGGNFIVRRCGDNQEFIAELQIGDPTPAIGDFVELQSQPFCIFQVVGLSSGTPTKVITDITAVTDCNEVCFGYNVVNNTAETQTIEYTDCSSVSIMYNLPPGYAYSFCALVGSISSSIPVTAVGCCAP